MLAPEDEVRAVTEVCQRLAGVFPELSSTEIEQVVRRSHDSFTDKPIRDFVPVLVERMARQVLLAQQLEPNGRRSQRTPQMSM